MLRKNKGFTLIELLVVIAIIGILASIVLVSLNSARQKARDVRRMGDLRQIALALEMYYDDKGVYPGTATGTCVAADWTAMKTALEASPVYMTQVPVDPTNSGTSIYSYSPSSTYKDYVLRAQLESATQIALKDDVDGADVYGCSCADSGGVSGDTNRYYCIRP